MKDFKHALLVMEKQDYPAEAREVIIRANEKIIADEKANKIYESMYRAYWKNKKNFHTFSDKSKELAELIGENVYTVYLVLLVTIFSPSKIIIE